MEGDFTEQYNNFVAFALMYGEDMECGWMVPRDIVESNTNITVNEDVVTEITYYPSMNHCECSTNASMGSFAIYPTHIDYEKAEAELD